MVGDLPKAKEHLAALDKLCFFTCAEYRDLKKAIERYERSREPRRSDVTIACDQRGIGKLRVLLVLVLLVALGAAYFWAMLTWSYSSGERAGWVQKLSRKGWVCKTWEGEMAMVSMPGSTSEEFALHGPGARCHRADQQADGPACHPPLRAEGGSADELLR